MFYVYYVAVVIGLPHYGSVCLPISPFVCLSWLENERAKKNLNQCKCSPKTRVIGVPFLANTNFWCCWGCAELGE